MTAIRLMFISVEHEIGGLEMTPKKRSIAGGIGLALVGVYSWIMMSSNGAAPWAWLVLVAGLALVAVAARSPREPAPDGQTDG